MTNNVNLVQRFGNDYYSIGLFNSVSIENVEQISDRESKTRIIFHIDNSNDELDHMTITHIKYEIMRHFIRHGAYDKLIFGYVLWETHKQSYDDYELFYEKLLKIRDGLYVIDCDIDDLYIELFNLVESYYKYNVIESLKKCGYQIGM